MVDRQTIYFILKGFDNKSPFFVFFSLGSSQPKTSIPTELEKQKH
jgi:hypothetical protein